MPTLEEILMDEYPDEMRRIMEMHSGIVFESTKPRFGTTSNVYRRYFEPHPLGNIFGKDKDGI